MKKFSLVIFCILLVSCGISQVLQIIDTVANVAIKASEVSGLIPPTYSSYIDTALSCSEFTASEYATMDSQAVKSTKVVENCLKASSQYIPTGLPTNLFNLALSVGQEIDKLLSAQ